MNHFWMAFVSIFHTWRTYQRYSVWLTQNLRPYPARPVRPDIYNFWGPKSTFMFIAFAFKIKISIIWKMTQWNYQLTKENWPVFELGTLLLIPKFGSDPNSYRAFRETGPWAGITLRITWMRFGKLRLTPPPPPTTNENKNININNCLK